MDTSAFDEKLLLQRVSDGDETAFRELFYHYADSLGAFVMRLTHSKMHAEEIVQDVFLKIWMNRKALAEVENFKVYLHVISRNHTLNAMRKVVRQMGHQKEWEKNQMVIAELPTKPEQESSVQLEGLIEGAIGRLPHQQQKAWLLSRKDGFTHPQIALAMGISRETVKKYIMYANHSITHFIRSRVSTPN